MLISVVHVVNEVFGAVAIQITTEIRRNGSINAA